MQLNIPQHHKIKKKKRKESAENSTIGCLYTKLLPFNLNFIITAVIPTYIIRLKSGVDLYYIYFTV